VDQLNAYFAGELTTFDLELDLRGTEFQRRVWQALLTIPFGETRSYGEVAEQIGAPGAARAVGLANGHNPIAIIVPCHPGHRRQRKPHRVRRWSRSETVAARARDKGYRRDATAFRLTVDQVSARLETWERRWLPAGKVEAGQQRLRTR